MAAPRQATKEAVLMMLPPPAVGWGEGLRREWGGWREEGEEEERKGERERNELTPLESRDGVLATQKDTLNVDVHGQVPDILGGVDGIVIVGVRDTSVVEDNVDLSELVLGLLEDGLHVLVLGDISLNGDGFTSSSVDFISNSLGSVTMEIDNSD